MTLTRLFLCLAVIALFTSGHGTTATAAETGPSHGGEVLVMPDGERLVLKTWLPVGEPDAVIVALHGINDYLGSFNLPAPFLARKGVAFYAYDQRGFGSSPNRGLWQGGETLTGDAREALRLIEDRHPGRPLYLLGESMGGASAIFALTGEAAPGISGLILVAPAVWGERHFNRFYRTALDAGSTVVPGLALPGRWSRVTFSDNEEEVAIHNSDPMVVHSTRLDTLQGVVDLMDDAMERSPALDLPILVLYGLKDEVIPKDAVCELLSTLGETSTAIFYPEGYHMLLRDRQRETVLRDLAAWIGDREAPPPSGLGHDCR